MTQSHRYFDINILRPSPFTQHLSLFSHSRIVRMPTIKVQLQSINPLTLGQNLPQHSKVLLPQLSPKHLFKHASLLTSPLTPCTAHPPQQNLRPHIPLLNTPLPRLQCLQLFPRRPFLSIQRLASISVSRPVLTIPQMVVPQLPVWECGRAVQMWTVYNTIRSVTIVALQFQPIQSSFL
jgi:hypothetical protein